MQLISATGEAKPGRSAGAAPPGPLTWLDHPAAASAIALAGWLAFVLARWQVWAAGRLTLFIMSGSRAYSHPRQMVPRISHVPLEGYDGQFYYRFARNPFNWDPTAYGITIDHNYRYTRIGYSLAAWALSGGGNPWLLPAALIVINLACVAGIAWLGARFARDSGRHALWGLAFAAYFGLVISVGRDTSEPLADVCLLAGLLALRRSRHGWATALLAYGVFTNEPVLVAPVAIAAVRLWDIAVRRRARPGRADLVWAVPGAVYVALQAAEKIVVPGQAGGVADTASNLTWPLGGLVPGVFRDIARATWRPLGLYDYNLLEFIALAIVVGAGIAVLRASTASREEKAVFAGFVAVEIVLASGQFWDSVFGDGRTYIDAFLMALVLLLATPASAAAETAAAATARIHSTPLRRVLARVFSADRVMPGRRLGWLLAVPVIVLILVARRHILFQ